MAENNNHRLRNFIIASAGIVTADLLVIQNYRELAAAISPFIHFSSKELESIIVRSTCGFSLTSLPILMRTILRTSDQSEKIEQNTFPYNERDIEQLQKLQQNFDRKVGGELTYRRGMTEYNNSTPKAIDQTSALNLGRQIDSRMMQLLAGDVLKLSYDRIVRNQRILPPPLMEELYLHSNSSENGIADLPSHLIWDYDQRQHITKEEYTRLVLDLPSGDMRVGCFIPQYSHMNGRPHVDYTGFVLHGFREWKDEMHLDGRWKIIGGGSLPLPGLVDILTGTEPFIEKK